LQLITFFAANVFAIEVPISSTLLYHLPAVYKNKSIEFLTYSQYFLNGRLRLPAIKIYIFSIMIFSDKVQRLQEYCQIAWNHTDALGVNGW